MCTHTSEYDLTPDYILILDVATNQDWHKAAAVRNKMIENLANAQDRLDELG